MKTKNNNKIDFKKHITLSLCAYFLMIFSQIAFSLPLLLVKHGNVSSSFEKQSSEYIGTLPLLIIALLVSPILEEWVYRKWLWKGILLKKFKNLYLTAFISSLVFALSHLSFNFLPFVGTGLVLCWLYHKSGSIINSMIVHSLYNATLVALYLVLFK